MLANYGYADGSGEYFITIDTDKCDGCEKCVEVCPKNIFEMVLDDYDKNVPIVKKDAVRHLEQECETTNCGYQCQKACAKEAISHSW